MNKVMTDVMEIIPKNHLFSLMISDLEIYKDLQKIEYLMHNPI